ncbi:hypothetical protein BOTBODRAFT_99027 [Botryobasidium botryosum FD-172 SS1]|uniref:tRNA (guanine(10)-N(2))-methyltransferase TRMT11 N-terminal domain-containing protein n=1 Tax=Botryobasidium botryosum (strain FD-172 SS1) TaxID=930990 RepID=A0A067NCQ4_BOTB1|nr:hypothetical protein BOTBODRAFT_99027 [Botryobasidium botryosum FD-172 SS1]
MAKDYFIHFAQAHTEFRLPELQSISELYGFSVSLPTDPQEQNPSRPFMIVGLESEDHARLLAGRCILVRAVYELWARGTSYTQLHAMNASRKHIWESYQPGTSFKFNVSSVNHTIPQARQREVMENFSYMAFQGPIDMKNPGIIMSCFEECKSIISSLIKRNDGDFKEAFFGKLVAEGSARSLISKFDVKKRVYFGNTSMESEVSLLMANQAQAGPGKIVYDPFAGTGSMLYTSAHFGAFVFGSDIDGRTMRGKNPKSSPGVVRAAQQYGVGTRLIDCCTFDVTKNPWRCGGIMDAIVTAHLILDSPQDGVRAGAKRLGRKEGRELRDMSRAAKDGTYIPPTKPYELSELAADLVTLSRYLLKPGGRLVFFLPTVTDEYEEVDVPTCEGMTLVANSMQNFGKWGRRVCVS